ncbi:MAG: 2-C-methyl-D-erythritol 4-phosphate cytidylyltransferase [Kiritimatiellae bacterium]|nr:2-C-methyl-D-erythritol 4-phosphate cytidylyltransferase [Kiritimatiellia bacterium]
MADRAWAIVLGAGREQKLTSGADTAFLSLSSRPAIAHLMCAVEACREVDGMVVVVAPDRVEMPQAMRLRFGITKLRAVRAGTDRRSSNLAQALEAFEEDVKWAVILETGRPTVGCAAITETLKAASRAGAACVAELITDPVLLVSGRTTRRLDVKIQPWVIRSPRAYRTDLLRKALALAARKRWEGPDESVWIEAAGGTLRTVPPTRPPVHLRTADDLSMAALLLSQP